jgi:hypothetical protein
MATTGISAGLVLGDGLELVEPHAKSRAWAHWRGRDASGKDIDVYLLSREALPFADEALGALQAADASPLAGETEFVGHGQERGRPWFAFRAPKGQSMDAWVRSFAERGNEPAYGDVHERMLLLLDLLTRWMEAEQHHGALTLARVSIAEDGGGISVTERVLGRLEAQVAAAASASEELPASIAPEVRADGGAAGASSDFWSFGVLFASALSATTPTPEALAFIIDDLQTRYGSDVADLLRTCLVAEDLMRPHDPRILRKPMRDALVSVRMLGLSDEIVGPGARPAPTRGGPGTADLFAGLDLVAGSSSEPGGRWLYSLGGVDYGPVSAARILELLHADEIDEFTDVIDTHSSQTLRLADVPEFSEAVRVWIPRREKMRAEREERRERIVTEAKRTSRTTVLAGAFAVVALAAIAWLTRPDAEALPLDALVLDFGFEVEAPRPDYQTIAADGDLLAALFNFEDPAPPPPPPPPSGRRQVRSSGAGGSTVQPGDDGDDGVDDYVLSFDSSRPSSKLTSDQINGTVRAHVGSIRPCLEREMRGNPGFRGVAVNWSIHPSGRTFNVNTSGMGSMSDEAERCIVRAFRGMRFPEFNDVPMSVSFPFHIQ